MKILTFVFFLALPCLIHAQGIKFSNNLTWAQVLQKAKKDHKYIFVDCYATWCGPCKMMDKNVYPNDTVGRYMNSKFISIRMQMDKSFKDDNNTKNRYAETDIFAKTYEIAAYPSFVFFSPDGTPLHKALGGRNVSQFMELLADAQNPKRQTYIQAKNTNLDQLDQNDLKSLLISAEQDNDIKLAGKIAQVYYQKLPIEVLAEKENVSQLTPIRADLGVRDMIIEKAKTLTPEQFQDEHIQSMFMVFSDDPKLQALAKAYIGTLSATDIFKRQNLYLLWNFFPMIEPGDSLFHLFYDNPAKVDSSMGRTDMAKGMYETVLYNKIAIPFLQKFPDTSMQIPDFNPLFDQLKKFSDIQTAFTINNKARMGFLVGKYQKALDTQSTQTAYWGQLYSDETMIRFLEQGADLSKYSVTGLNNNAFEIFKYHGNKRDLEMALSWVEKALSDAPKPYYSTFADTKANILYRLGRNSEAISLEEQVVKLQPKTPEFSSTLEKMKKGLPTWLVGDTNDK